MEHFIIIRFSVRFKNRPEFDKKQNILFDKERMNFRFKLFEEYCLKSLVNQTLKDFKIIILYDKDLEQEYKNKLFNLTKEYSFIILHEWNINDNLTGCKWIKKYLPENYNNYIITTRLDDDDIINYDLNRRLKRYINKFNCKGKIIGFQGGYFLNMFSENNLVLFPIKYSGLSVFQTKIHLLSDINIYGHDHHNHNLPSRIIKTNKAFIQINHKYENDNRLARFAKKKGDIVSYKEICDIMN